MSQPRAWDTTTERDSFGPVTGIRVPRTLLKVRCRVPATLPDFPAKLLSLWFSSLPCTWRDRQVLATRHGVSPFVWDGDSLVLACPEGPLPGRAPPVLTPRGTRYSWFDTGLWAVRLLHARRHLRSGYAPNGAHEMWAAPGRRLRVACFAPSSEPDLWAPTDQPGWDRDTPPSRFDVYVMLHNLILERTDPDWFNGGGPWWAHGSFPLSHLLVAHQLLCVFRITTMDSHPSWTSRLERLGVQVYPHGVNFGTHRSSAEMDILRLHATGFTEPGVPRYGEIPDYVLTRDVAPVVHRSCRPFYKECDLVVRVPTLQSLARDVYMRTAPSPSVPRHLHDRAFWQVCGARYAFIKAWRQRNGDKLRGQVACDITRALNERERLDEGLMINSRFYSDYRIGAFWVTHRWWSYEHYVDLLEIERVLRVSLIRW